jgi:hypothetical protein
MEKNSIILIILGLFITIILSFIDIYLAGIVCVLIITIVMSLMIMQDTQGIPEIIVRLRDDAKAIILTNNGNSKAEKIHVSLVPANLEYDIPILLEDATYQIPLASMIEEIKVVVTYENEKGRSFSLSSRLSSMEEEPDLFKPIIPIFKWKK